MKTVYLLSISGTHSPFVNIARQRDSKTNIMDEFNFKIKLGSSYVRFEDGLIAIYLWYGSQLYL